jgi:basic membrane protein A
MTKVAALLLAGSLGLAACASGQNSGGSAGSSSSGGELKIGLAYDTGGRGDRSFNDSAHAGVEAATKTNGGTLSELSPNSDASNRADLLTQLADQGYNPVIAVGFAYGNVIGAVAKQYPDTTFAVVDSSVTQIGAKNLTGLVFAEEQGSFLAGVAAALKTSAGHIGFVGGVETPLIQKFEAGYFAGAQAVKPDIKIDSKYLTPAGDFSGFNDPAKGQIAAQGMYDAGADIVYHAAGGSGLGVFQAAAASNKRAIGVDSDQYKTVDDPALQAVIMTSMLKRVDNAVQAFIGDFAGGKVAGGKDVVNDLSTDGIGLATTGGFIDDIKGQIDGFRKKIIDGSIKVPTTRCSEDAGLRRADPRSHRWSPRRRAPAHHARARRRGDGTRFGESRGPKPSRTPGCDIMRPAPCRAHRTSRQGCGPAGDAGRTGRHSCRRADVRRAPRAYPKEADHGRNWSDRWQPGRGPLSSRCPVCRGAARDHQALPGRRGQPEHRAAGASR